LQIDWFTFSAQIINFLILIWLLKKFLYGPILNVMKKREDIVASRLEEARYKLEEAEEMINEYRGKMVRLEERKEEWFEEVKQEAESYKKELIQNARSEVEEMASKWQESVNSERSSFLEALEKQSFEQIVSAVERIIKDLADGKLEEQALKIFLGKIEQMDPDEKEKIAKTAMNGNVEFLTAFEMNEQDKNRVTEIFRELFSGVIECQFKTDTELGFGLEIRSNGWKLGWNMKSYLADLLTEMEDFIDSEIDSGKESETAESSDK
jgi:F-type H+-transporting ATPase subunit b